MNGNRVINPAHRSWHRYGGVGLAGIVAVICLATWNAQPAAAQRTSGEWIAIPSPITGDVVKRITNDIDRAIKNRQARVLVFQFQSGEASQFEPCSELAKAILAVQGQAESYAFIDGELRGHAVLAALSCQRIWMKPAAGIGDANHRQTRAIDDAEQLRYILVAEARGKPVPLVLKMLHADLTVFKVKSVNGVSYKLAKDAAASRRGIDFNDPKHAAYFITDADMKTQPEAIRPGQVGFFNTKEALEIGLAGREFATPQEVVEALNLPGSVIKGNPLQDQSPRAGWIEVHGEIHRGTADTVDRQIRRALDRDKANILIFDISASGGTTDAITYADRVARKIQETNNKVLTVAFIPNNAKGAATLLAIGCNQIVMGQKAEMGDFDAVVFPVRGQPAPDVEIKPFRESLTKLAEEQGYSPVLFEGLMNPAIEIVQVESKPDPNQPGAIRRTFMKKQDYEQEKDKWNLVPGGTIKKPGALLKLDADRAFAWGIARHKVENPAMASVLALYGVDTEKVTVQRADWLDELVNILTNPVVTVFLVIVGFTCLLLEIKAPGLGIPAIISAVCFVLIFWSYSWLSQEVNSLAILLFLLGLILIGVEIFVLPGFGIWGIGGVILLLLALALAVAKQWPQSEAEYLDLGKNIAIFGGGLLASLFGAFTIARYLPSIPYASRLMLAPPDEESGDTGVTLPLAQSPALLGQIGSAVTELRPAGKARFGEEFVDVIAEGSFVSPGTRVQVVEMDGMRVVVKAV